MWIQNIYIKVNKARWLRLSLAHFLTMLFYHRFEFDVSLEEATSRKLDISVKNNKMFHTREKKDIGMVGNTICDCQCLFSPGAIFQRFKYCILFDRLLLSNKHTATKSLMLAHYGVVHVFFISCRYCRNKVLTVEFGPLLQFATTVCLEN